MGTLPAESLFMSQRWLLVVRVSYARMGLLPQPVFLRIFGIRLYEDRAGSPNNVFLVHATEPARFRP